MIPREFFQRDPLACARELIGCTLVWGECAGIVVETEAYSAIDDEASHTFSRPSTRVFVAKHPPGTAYVYFNYGMYWLFNVLVKGGKEDGFVLFRALEPRAGIPLMERRRGQRLPFALCSGPGKLTQALAITGADHGRDLCSIPSASFLERSGPAEVAVDARVGISKAAHFPWRFLQRDSPFVSVRLGVLQKLQAKMPNPSAAMNGSLSRGKAKPRKKEKPGRICRPGSEFGD